MDAHQARNFWISQRCLSPALASWDQSPALHQQTTALAADLYPRKLYWGKNNQIFLIFFFFFYGCSDWVCEKLLHLVYAAALQRRSECLTCQDICMYRSSGLDAQSLDFKSCYICVPRSLYFCFELPEFLPNHGVKVLCSQTV